MDTLQIIVTFDEGISSDVQGRVLLAMEKSLRYATGQDCRVYKAKKADDQPRRVAIMERK